MDFKDFRVRVYKKEDINIHNEDFDFTLTGGYTGVQTNTNDNNKNREIINICNQIQKYFEQLYEKLDSINNNLK